MNGKDLKKLELQTLSSIVNPQARIRIAPKMVMRRIFVPVMLVVLMFVSGAAGGGIVYNVMKDDIKLSSANDNYAIYPTLVNNAIPTNTSIGDVVPVVKKSADTVVEIFTETRQFGQFTGNYVAEGAGSGVIISEDGYIVTNNHVISGANTIKVLTTSEKEYDAVLIAADAKTDLAVIKIEASGLNAPGFSDSDKIEVGQMAVAIGNPLGSLGGTVTSGIISAKGREITIDQETMTLLQTSAAVNPGNSGGGLFDINGDLIGIVNAKSSGMDVEGLAFAIPSNTVQAVVKDLVEKGYVSGRPQLGITVREIKDRYSLSMYRLTEPGVYITSTTVSSALAAGDLILSVGGIEIKSNSDLSAAIKKFKVGDSVEVMVKRSGKTVTLKVTLTEQKPQNYQISSL